MIQRLRYSGRRDSIVYQERVIVADKDIPFGFCVLYFVFIEEHLLLQGFHSVYMPCILLFHLIHLDGMELNIYVCHANDDIFYRYSLCRSFPLQ